MFRLQYNYNRVCLVSTQFSLNITDDPKEGHSNQIERAEIAQLVRSRMTSLGECVLALARMVWFRMASLGKWVLANRAREQK